MVLQSLFQLLRPTIILNNSKSHELVHHSQHQLRLTRAKHKQNNVVMA